MSSSTTAFFFEGSDAVEGCYRCVITPKAPDDDRDAVFKVGQALLRLRNDEPGVRTISFEGVPRGRTHDAFVDFINGKNSWPAHFPFDRSQYTQEQVARTLRKYFPRSVVKDVTIEGQSIYGGNKG